MPRIAFFGINHKQFHFLHSAIKNHTNIDQKDVLFFHDNNILEHLDEIKDIEVLSVFCDCVIDKNIIEKLPKLGLISTRSTGFDHIDIDLAKSKEIEVSNVPEYGSNTVAEYTFALLLNVTRQVYRFSERTDNGDYTYSDFQGMDLNGKTIGVVGVGNIGKKVVKIAKGFGMNVLVFSKSIDFTLANELGFQYVVNLDYLLSKSDIITLHLPYNKSTHHLINQENIMKMKKGGILLNTSRGAVVENEAILAGLKSGIIKYAGLDVIENEDDLLHGKGNDLAEYLAKKEEVVYSPHVAYYTKEAEQRILETTVNNINAFVNGKVINKVDKA